MGTPLQEAVRHLAEEAEKKHEHGEGVTPDDVIAVAILRDDKFEIMVRSKEGT